MMFKRLLALICFLFSACFVYAQGGSVLVASYAYETKPSDAVLALPEAVRQKVLEQLQAQSATYYLYSNGSEHMFTKDNAQGSPLVPALAGTMSCYMHTKKNLSIANRTILDKHFLVTSVPTAREWNITGEEREILGKRCVLAYLQDRDDVKVWFSPEVPVNTGPSDYMGLPGLVCAVETNDMLLTLTALRFVPANQVKFTVPKGKTITIDEYNAIQDKKLRDLGADPNKDGVQIIRL